MKLTTRRSSAVVLGLALLASGLAAQAGNKVYRWVDKNGNVHYTDQPPANLPATTVNVDAGGATAGSAAPGSTDEGNDKTADKPAAAKSDGDDCQKLKDKLVSYKAASKITETNSLGNVHEFSDAERQKLIEVTEQKIKSACQGGA